MATAKSGQKTATKTRSGTARSASKASTESAKGRPWTFPKNTLEDSIRVARAIEEKNGGNPMPADSLAIAVGFRQASDWRFLDLLRSANQYGLVEGTQKTPVQLARIGQDVVAPSTPHQRTEALTAAFRNVPDFASVEKFYQGKRIPEDEFFFNTLTREFGVPRERVDQFAIVFVENLRFLRAFSSNVSGGDESNLAVEPFASTQPEKVSSPVVLKEPRSREFLDTCFVMMPFGEWFDRYYQEIYAPGINEAGFEAIRGDELFHTGSVMEQIWEQIEKAKILLADLSGKNPNVFYELGLAHAARKPVVFTASNLDDVPFDLRHLRVIIYDIREPEWASRLRASVADYLRNAAREPTKSIPHPFRGSAEEDAAAVRAIKRAA